MNRVLILVELKLLNSRIDVAVYLFGIFHHHPFICVSQDVKLQNGTNTLSAVFLRDINLFLNATHNMEMIPCF
jgi:hypothetical protein